MDKLLFAFPWYQLNSYKMKRKKQSLKSAKSIFSRLHLNSHFWILSGPFSWHQIEEIVWLNVVHIPSSSCWSIVVFRREIGQSTATYVVWKKVFSLNSCVIRPVALFKSQFLFKVVVLLVKWSSCLPSTSTMAFSTDSMTIWLHYLLNIWSSSTKKNCTICQSTFERPFPYLCYLTFKTLLVQSSECWES